MRERNIVTSGSVRALACLLVLGGCSSSVVEGPQVKRVPAGYGFSSQLSGARNVFRDERPSDEFGWMKARGETHGSIEINVWDRAFSLEEARVARAEHAARWSHASYDEASETKIDGRPALYWFVRQAKSRECVAVVPYGDATYVIEYYSAFADEQDDAEMLSVVRSFRRSPGRAARLLVPLAFLAGLAGTVVAVRRMRA